MIPTVELMYNYEYAKRLYRGDENFEDVWRRIIGLGADFEKIYNEYIEHVLVAIEKYSGFAWEENADPKFPIYLSEIDSSFVHPLTLAANKDIEAMLYDLIYQLSHRNMLCGFKTDELQYKCLNLVTDYVLKKLNVKKDKIIDEWNLENKTIKEYLNLLK